MTSVSGEDDGVPRRSIHRSSSGISRLGREVSAACCVGVFKMIGCYKTNGHSAGVNHQSTQYESVYHRSPYAQTTLLGLLRLRHALLTLPSSPRPAVRPAAVDYMPVRSHCRADRPRGRLRDADGRRREASSFNRYSSSIFRSCDLPHLEFLTAS